MVLHVSQKIFSWRSKAFVEDEYGQKKYFIKSPWLSWGTQCRIYNPDGSLAAEIKESVLIFNKRYHVHINGLPGYTVKIRRKIGNGEAYVEGGDLTASGRFFIYNYDIMQNGVVVARVEKDKSKISLDYKIIFLDDSNFFNILIFALSIELSFSSSFSDLSRQ